MNVPIRRPHSSRNRRGLLHEEPLIRNDVPGYIVEQTYDLLEYDFKLSHWSFLPYYEEKFFEQPHSNFISTSYDHMALVSILHPKYRKNTNQTKTFALIRLPSEDIYVKFLVTLVHETQITKKELLKQLKEARSEVELLPLKLIKEDSFKEKLLDLERTMIPPGYKFGLLYCIEGQMSEDDMYSNNDPSTDYLEFLEFIGQKVKLSEFSGYTGGLKTEKNMDGEFSVATEHENYPIMFHVSTYLPFYEKDEQQIARKRHIGNDIVVLIFKEGNTPFSPAFLASHFNHVFVVVQKDLEKTQHNSCTTYRVSTSSKIGVGIHTPHIPPKKYFQKGDEFKKWLLTKLINAERAALQAEELKNSLIWTREQILTSLLKSCKEEKII